MISNKEFNREFFSELILIVGSFLFAETIIRWFVDLSLKAQITPWVLPALGIGLVLVGLQIKKSLINGYSICSWIFLVAMVIISVLRVTDNISIPNYLWTVLISTIVIIIINIISLVKNG